MRRRFAILSGMAVAASVLVAPSLSAHAAQDVSYLFVVDSTDIRVTPLEGDAARVEISRAAVTRFTDRPAREAESIGTRGMLREFGWTAKSKRLKDSTPNAAISIAGERSQIVDIKRARVADGRVVLRVIGINGPLESMRGAGSIFVDNAATYPVQQTLPIQFVEEPVGSATITWTSPSLATLEITMNVAPSVVQTFDVTIGEPQSRSWKASAPGDYIWFFDANVNSSVTSFGSIVHVAVTTSSYGTDGQESSVGFLLTS